MMPDLVFRVNGDDRRDAQTGLQPFTDPLGGRLGRMGADMDGEFIRQVVMAGDIEVVLADMGNLVQGGKHGLGVKRGPADLHHLLFAPQDGSQARGSTATGTAPGDQEPDVAGFEAEQGHAFDGQRGQDDFAGRSRRDRLILVVQDLDHAEVRVQVAALLRGALAE